MSTHVESKPITFGEARKVFTDAGIPAEHLLPLVPTDAKLSDGSKLGSKDMGKTPGRWNARAGTWSGLSKVNGNGGPSHFAAPLPADFVANSAGWPTPNVGIRGAAYPGVDADVGSATAARIVDQAITGVFGLDGYGIRFRGNSPRSLYAFAGDVAPRPGALVFILPEDARGSAPHVVEIIGRGKHFVVAGVHPSGDAYGWDREADLAELARAGDLTTLAEADLDRFFDALAREVERAGGTVQGRQDGHGTGGWGDRHDWSRSEPVAPVGAVLDALWAYPNTPEHLATHGDATSFLAKLYAALGREADAPDVVAEVEEWALDRADDFDTPPTAEWFQARWASFAGGVEHGQYALRMHLADNGIRFGAKFDFPDDEIAEKADKLNREWVVTKAHQRRLLLSSVAEKFLFAPVDASTVGEAFPMVRSRAALGKAEKGQAWWLGKALISDESLMTELHETFGGDEQGFWRFFRSISQAHPACIYQGTVKHPLFDIGHMVENADAQGNTYFELNIRALPAVQKRGATMPKGSGDPKRNADVAIFLDFVNRMFGEHARYELDCIAHMAQTGLRPGNLLFLMGDGHTGKTLYADALNLMFDGGNRTIAGGKLKESTQFAFLPFEGARIGQILELPAELSKDTKAALDSIVKIMVDASRKDATFPVEGKGKDIREVPNYVRLVITSNFQGALYIGEHDRRMFYVINGITGRNPPPTEWWAKVNPVMKEERRLASIWRYLLDRDTGDYDRTSPPPVTNAKKDAQRSSIHNPVQRHARDAVSALIAAGRLLVDTKEMGALMTAVAHNEWENSGHQTDDRPDGKYDLLKSGAAPGLIVAELGLAFTKLAQFKSGSVRLPTIYVRKGAPEEIGLDGAGRELVLRRLEDDRSRHPLREDHLGEAVRGPVNPPTPGADDFPDD